MSIPSSPESFFSHYIPERFSGLPGFEQVSSLGSVAFAVPDVGSWSFKLRAGRLSCELGVPSDTVVRITIPQASFEPIVVRGTERMLGLALAPEKQMLAFRALTLDAERLAQIRSVVGSVSFAVLEGSSSHRVFVTPGVAEPNLAQPECEISCESEAFWGLQTGTQNPIELLMSGKIKIAGDAQIPMALSSLFV
ncbi:MAG TPA: SCP2 sterol-binding domain-containing protein [Polyangiaceae bacterium]|nr:SCP2 sterol-binding domain-containing protein [Polyangiaceae bacterium]